MLQEYLDEKNVFKSLFFQNIYDPEKDERRLKRLERERQLQEAAEAAAEERLRRMAERGDEEGEESPVPEEEEEDEEEMYFGPPPIPLKLYVDKITDWFHPFDVQFVYFTRLDRGPISEPQSDEAAESRMSSVCNLLEFISHFDFTDFFQSLDADKRVRRQGSNANAL